jgi:hypothetical protein
MHLIRSLVGKSSTFEGLGSLVTFSSRSPTRDDTGALSLVFTEGSSNKILKLEV